ncbi:DUF2637 domain-containing protein [Streptomonospora sp. S1-112]|uniref:DUF2637 domain-containing protein n=1 Tax=Streptomonospora mangrovi TaxID=2883123 RepID=A0A9X3NNC2_9ACTN|nr:DUF2637 domain-containing protein [Streptomonospora mangrovi]MDA0565216.1 DUF2637 domain-containing protein [Streptomonospora mangrovi]
MSSPAWSRWITTTTVLLLAAIAAVVSYAHMFELALRHGEPAWRAGLFPLSVDGMIVAASMALLADARQGRRGGVLPWALLVVGSAASLAANVAVADPTLWSRVIHAWPSFALMGAYELLMRHFRVAADREEAASPRGEHRVGDENEDTAAPAARQRGGEGTASLHVVGSDDACHLPGVGPDGAAPALPRVQVEAWQWAVEHRRSDGSLPSGEEIAAVFGRKPRWGRLVKQRGQQGAFRRVVA